MTNGETILSNINKINCLNNYIFSNSPNIANLKKDVIEQVAHDKLSILLKIAKKNTQTLQLFTNIIKMENIYKSN